MARNKETVAKIVREMRDKWALCYFSEGTRRIDGEYSEIPSIDSEEVAYRIEAAHKHEIAAKDRKIELLEMALKTSNGMNDAASEMAVAKNAEIAKLRECLEEAITAKKIDGNCFGRGWKCETCGRACVANKWRKALEGGVA